MLSDGPRGALADAAPRLVPPVVLPGRMSESVQPSIAVDAELRLRAWQREDAHGVMTAFSEPDIRHWHSHHCDDLDTAESWVAEASAGWDSERTATWAVVRSVDDVLVGRIGLTELDLPAGRSEVSYWVLPFARGSAVAARATNAIVHWAFTVLGLHRLEIMHSVENAASCRVAQRAGFQMEGTMRSALLHADGWHDMHLHSRIYTDHVAAGAGADAIGP